VLSGEKEALIILIQQRLKGEQKGDRRGRVFSFLGGANVGHQKKGSDSVLKRGSYWEASQRECVILIPPGERAASSSSKVTMEQVRKKRGFPRGKAVARPLLEWGACFPPGGGGLAKRDEKISPPVAQREIFSVSSLQEGSVVFLFPSL